MFGLVQTILALYQVIGFISVMTGYGIQKEDPDIAQQRRDKNYKIPMIHVRFVSKGVNPIQITNSLIDIQQTVNHPELRDKAHWAIEVVTDNYMDLGWENRAVNQVVVPSDYVTPKNTLFKARALHQAANSVGTDQDAWILHMDEESYFNVENGHKIVLFCDNENQLIRQKNQRPSFANGYITYFKDNKMYSILNSISDTVRISDDYLKMRWSFTFFNKCQLGIKGSNWIIHSALERHLGFDIGTKRSVGEDYTVSLIQNHNGQPIKWQDAVIEEQSPFCFSDFHKQRNRWQKALWLTAINSTEISWDLRLMMQYMCIVFFCVPLGIMSVILYFGNMFSILLIGTNFSPLILDSWVQNIMFFNGFIGQLVFNFGFHKSGVERTGYGQYILGTLLFLSGLGNVISALCENQTLVYFMLFVDKQKLEFKVINKDLKENDRRTKKNENSKFVMDDCKKQVEL